MFKFDILFVLGVLLGIRLTLAMVPIEVMEFSCAFHEQCQYYETDNIESYCSNSVCQCHNKKTNTKTICQPKILHTTNIIGGYCPCNLPDTKCNISTNLCYCKPNFIPSKDKRRCIPKEVSLGEFCEVDDQCMASNVFSHCANETKLCTCNKNFLGKGTICIAQTKLRSNCTDEMNCLKRGANKICLPEIGECVCKLGYISDDNSEDCLPGRKLDEECRNSMQCSMVMGPGGSCENGKCRCKAEFSIVKKKKNDGDSMENVCEPLVQIGQYCSLDEHCHNGHLNEGENSMKCDHAECVCRFGIKNQVPCSTSIASKIITSKICVWFMLVVVGVLKFASVRV